MKQRDIDRWVNRQARMNRQAHTPPVNWTLIASIMMMVCALLIIILKAAHVL
jgi:uncharacterized membrane protein YidH (DUF202 family)